MATIRVPLLGGATENRSRPMSGSNLANVYPEKVEGGRSPLVFHGTPGKVLFSTCGSGPHRGAWDMNEISYFVSGTTLYSVDSGGTETSLGTIAGTSRVSMSDNKTQLVIVNGTQGYVYTVAAGLAQITDPDFLGADYVTYQDGYFFFNQPSTGRCFCSAINDATSLDALDIATAEAYPDDLLLPYSLTEILYLIGKKSVEGWYNAANATGFPFSRLNGSVIKRGCAARFSVAEEDNALFMLGDDRIIYRMSGNSIIRISDHDLEEVIRKFTTVSDAFGYIYTMSGHKFYVLTFPTESQTWVCDISSNYAWHQRISYGYTRDIGNSYVYCYGKHLVGSYVDGNVYELDIDAYDENGEPIVREIITPDIHAEDKPFSVNNLRAIIETGVGLEDGTIPYLSMSFSIDGGRTWSNSIAESFGAVGEYKTLVEWDSLGQALQMRFKLTTGDKVKFSMIDLYAMIEVGR